MNPLKPEKNENSSDMKKEQYGLKGIPVSR
jgi:hypothetical protein